MKIDVRIPYEPGGKLGWDYNRIMMETPHDWVLFLDHDVLLSTNQNWYHICQKAIEQYPQAGLFTCMTNKKHKYGSHEPDSPQTDVINNHRDFAKIVWSKHKDEYIEIEKSSGFFMLCNKKAWKEVGGFPGKAMFGEDLSYSKRLKTRGFSIKLIRGLYVYHDRHRDESLIDGLETTKEVRFREQGK